MSTPARLPGEEGRGVLGRITVEVYWLGMLTAFFALACLPGGAVVLVMEPGRPSIWLLALALVPVGPALSATVFAWQHRTRTEDPAPWRCFAAGYRLSALDVLKVWLPSTLALAILGTGVLAARLGVVPAGYLAVLAVIAVGILLSTVHALMIATFFSFRVRDVFRLAVFHTFRMPRATAGVAALLLCTGALLVLAGDWAALLAAGALTRALGHYEKPLLQRIRTEFTTGPASDPAAPAVRR